MAAVRMKNEGVVKGVGIMYHNCDTGGTKLYQENSFFNGANANLITESGGFLLTVLL